MAKNKPSPLPPSRTADQFVVRLPDGMRERIAETAKTNGRSMNAEIVARLDGSFGPEYPSDDVLKLAHLLMDAAQKADFSVRVMIGTKGDKFEDIEFKPKSSV